jgi:hypothetical protein
MSTEKLPREIGGYEVKEYDYSVMHRGQLDALTHYVEELAGYVDGCEMTLVREAVSGLWLITPNEPDNEEIIEDIGPYDNLEEAFLHFKLITDPY